jgi:hypothetical protein
MAGLTVKDAMTRIDQVEKDLNEKFTKLVDELKQVLAETENTCGCGCKTDSVEVGTLDSKVEDIRNDLIGHIQVYNQHIIQQHGKKKG